MQAVLYPMIGILGVSYGVFNATSALPELAIVLAGVVASGLIGAFYLGLPVGILRAKVRRLRATNQGKTLETLLAYAVAANGALVAIGELAASSTLLMIATSALVLSTMALAAATVSNTMVRLSVRSRAS